MKEKVPSDLILKTSEQKSAYYRGAIIQLAIWVELRMDIIIGRYLSNNNDEKITETISLFDNSESIGFHAKNLAIQYIIKKAFPDFLKHHKTLLSDLDKLIKTRNNVAHKRPDYNNGDFSKLIWAKTSKNSIINKSQLINNKEFKDYELTAHNVMVDLIEIDILLMEKAKFDKTSHLPSQE